MDFSFREVLPPEFPLGHNILRGLLRREPDLDIVRIQDAGLSGEDDPTILETAFSHY